MLAVVCLAHEDLQVIHPFPGLERHALCSVVALGVAGEVHRDLGPLAFRQSGHLDVVVVSAVQAKMLKGCLGVTGQLVAQVEKVLLAQPETRRVDAGHDAGKLLVRSGGHAHRRGVAQVLGEIVPGGGPEPCELLRLEITGCPDPMRKGLRFRALRHSLAARPFCGEG